MVPRQLAAAKDEHFVKRWWRFRRIHRRFGWKFWAFISGGAALDAETEEFWQRLSFVVIQGYGLTETTSLISLNHPFRTGRRSIGKVLEGREMKLDEQRRDPGSRRQRCRRLLAGHGAEAGAERGRLVSHRRHRRARRRGQSLLQGRKKNVIVTREGMNVYPEDLEAALRQQPEVRDCVVVGLEQGGNAEPCAVLVLRDSADPQTL
jgi:long-chain acyl-CoA synthetase